MHFVVASFRAIGGWRARMWRRLFVASHVATTTHASLPPADPPQPIEDQADIPLESSLKVGDHSPLPHLSPAEPPTRLPSGTFVGDHTFRGAILSNLDNYFYYLARMKKVDRASYDLYSQIGMSLLPDNFQFYEGDLSAGTLPAWWKNTRPSFGGVAYAISDELMDRDRKRTVFLPRFVYYRKYERKHSPSGLQPARPGHDVYLCTYYFAEPRGEKKSLSAPITFGVSLGLDGDVRPMKVRSVARAYRTWGGTWGPQMSSWEYDPRIATWAAEHKKEPGSFMREMFCNAAFTHEVASSGMVKVSVGSRGLRAVFCVDIQKTPDFFKDRDQVVVEGVKKRIFHIVRPHERVGSKGVRMHFRGLRRFDWNGYKVEIAVPGYTGTDVRDFGAPSIDVPEDAEVNGFLDSRQIGQMLNECSQQPVARHPLH